MTGLFSEIADGEKSICYIVSLPIERMTKLGYTNVTPKIRVSRFRFSHDLTGMEKDVVIVGEYETPMAKTIEHYAKKIADRKYDKVMDKNMGSGYTEWYFCSPLEMRSCVLNAFKYVRWDKRRKSREAEKAKMSNSNAEKQMELDL
tara:strand:- start:4 stop:441 length:438 start_codon:yes stop_codon:yes gene_type:complete